MDNLQDSPCGRWAHDHPPIRNINEQIAKSQTLGQRVADRIASLVGSWPFLITQTLLLTGWIIFNASKGRAWDPYPFILLNLLLSFQAAYTGPVVLMSQNRQADKDRLTAQRDYEVDQRAETEVAVIMRHLLHQDQQMALLRDELAALRRELKQS